MNLCWSHKSYSRFCRALAQDNNKSVEFLNYGNCIPFVDFSPFQSRATTVFTSCLLICKTCPSPPPLKMGPTLKGKLLPRVDHFSQGRQNHFDSVVTPECVYIPLQCVLARLSMISGLSCSKLTMSLVFV